jgi:hypothetical protein
MSPLGNFPFFVPCAKHSIRKKFQNPTALFSPVIRTAVQHGIQHWDVGCIELRTLEKETCCDRVNKMFWMEYTTQGVREK